MRGSRKLCRTGSNFDNVFLLFCVFLVEKGREDAITTISGLSSARQRNANNMAFHLRADGGRTLNAGLAVLIVIFPGFRASIAKKPYLFLIFQRRFGPLPPSGYAHVNTI